MSIAASQSQQQNGKMPPQAAIQSSNPALVPDFIVKINQILMGDN